MTEEQIQKAAEKYANEIPLDFGYHKYQVERVVMQTYKDAINSDLAFQLILEGQLKVLSNLKLIESEEPCGYTIVANKIKELEDKLKEYD